MKDNEKLGLGLNLDAASRAFSQKRRGSLSANRYIVWSLCRPQHQCSRPWQNATPPSHRVVEHNIIPGNLDVPPAQRARGLSVLLEPAEDPFQDAMTMSVDHVACAR